MRRCRFGLFEFDLESGELRRDGEIVKLAPQPTRVLTLLLERPGELVLRETLKAHLWGDDTFVDFERGLNFCILQVRGALGDASDNPRFVQTVPRRGYRFIAPVSLPAPVPVETPSTSLELPVQERTPDETAGVRSLRPRWLIIAAVLAIVAATATLAIRGRSAGAPAVTETGSPVRVAVLPFLNLTGDQRLDYLGDGLTDEVIAQLGVSGPQLAVIARTSAMAYRQSQKSVAQIGAELGVSHVVESSVRQHGQGLRIASNLVRVADQSRVQSWVDTFDPVSAAGSLQQTRVASRLAHLIAVELQADPKTAAAEPSTADSDAWNAYLKGKALTGAGAVSSLREALGHFEAAVKRDPAFAAAWAKIAETRHVLVMMGAEAPGDAYTRARTAADRAISNDPNLPDAHLARGLIHLWREWRPEEAGKSFEQALSLNPSHAAAHHDYAWSLAALGRDREATQHVGRARDLDPASSRATADAGWLFLQIGEPAEAARACERTLALEPASVEAQGCLERAFVQRGSFDAALECAKATLPRASAVVLPPGGPPEESLRAIWRWRLQQLEQAARTRWVSPYMLAGLRVSLGDKEGAIDDLEAAYDDRVGMMLFLHRDPIMDPIRQHPRVQALIRQVADRSTTSAGGGY